MDIHKPKPVHNLREFLSEISVIVVGIVIALLLEQAVEAINRNREVGETREALRAEIHVDTERLKLTIEQNKCLDHELDDYAAWARGGPKPPPYRTFTPSLRVEVWDTVKGGAVAHMPLKERISLSSFYDLMNGQMRSRDKMGQVNDSIISFEELQTLNEGQREELLRSVALAKRITHDENGAASRLIGYADEFGQPTEPVALPKILRPGVDWVCGRNPTDPYLSQY